MALDPAAINAALYAVIKSDAAGASARAATGAGTSAGVIPAHALRAPALPARPFLAWRAGVVSGESEEMRGIGGAWWAYDDSQQGYARIDALLGLVEAAYAPPEGIIAGGRTVVSSLGPQSEDGAINLYCRFIQITHRRRA